MGIQERLDALQPRERRLLLVFAGLFVVIAVLAIPLAVSAALAERREDNEQLQYAIGRIASERDAFAERRAASERVIARYRTAAPALAGFIERQAQALEIEIPEFKDRPIVPLQNKRYEERSTEIRVKAVGMRSLILFLEKIAQAPYPISITKLSIRKRAAKEDTWDATLIVSAFHMSEDALAKLNSPKKSPGAGAAEATP